MNFYKAEQDFNKKFKNKQDMTSLARIRPGYMDGYSDFNHFNDGYPRVNIKDENNKPNEEYYRQCLLYCLFQNNLFNRDYMCLEMMIPSGRTGVSFIRPDIVIFDSKNWWPHYKTYSTNKKNDSDDLNWLENHMLVEIECKNTPKETVPRAWEQLKSYMQKSTRNTTYGIVCDKTNIYLFKRIDNHYIRLINRFNDKGKNSTTSDLNLDLTDRYTNVAGFKDLIKDHYKGYKHPTFESLNTVSNVHSHMVKDALLNTLKSFDNNGIDSQTGFDVLIQSIATKIYDEKIHKTQPTLPLDFYITPKELTTSDLKINRKFVQRIRALFSKAEENYNRIINLNNIDFGNTKVINVLKEIIYQFQYISFVKSSKSNLYQLVFNQFASKFEKAQNGEFLTPLAIINFLVELVRPVRGESLLDPTVGTADFLSVSFVKSVERHNPLDDHDIYGMDIDPQMIKLAQLNMLLNGDGNSKILAPKGPGDYLGSLKFKFTNSNNKAYTSLEKIAGTKESNGSISWNDPVNDDDQMKKFDVILTNPPFGKNRAFKPNNPENKKISHEYELFQKYGRKKLDKGVLFLENMVKSLNSNGRYGIVLSNSIASVSDHEEARKWLINHTRIVGIFDLPANTFADTGVNTTVILGYKPKNTSILNSNYEVYSQTIKNTGYKVRTHSRTKGFEPVLQLDNQFKPKINHKTGGVIIKEDFTKAINEFRKWARTQESTVKNDFGGIRK